MANLEIQIKNGKFTQGELSFDIDTADLAKALQQVDKLTVAQHREIAKLNGIMVEPFDRRLLRPVVLGLVQSAWYKGVKGTVPEKVAASQTNRVAAYLKQLEDLKNVPTEDLVATRSRKASTKSEAAPKAALAYLLDEPKVTALLAKDVKQRPSETRLIGQQYMVVETMRELAAAKKPATVDAISTAVKSNPYTITPGKTNISFHINAFKKIGLVVAVDDKGEAVKEDPKGDKKPAAATTTTKVPVAPSPKKK